MGVFSLSVFNPLVFSTSSSPVVDFGGGGFDVEKYRKYLERLNGIERRETVTAAEAVEIQEISAAVKVKAPEAKKATVASRAVDYSIVQQEISDIRNKLIALMEMAILLERKRQQNEDAVLVLLMC